MQYGRLRSKIFEFSFIYSIIFSQIFPLLDFEGESNVEAKQLFMT